jgi:hypothetical protein
LSEFREILDNCRMSVSIAKILKISWKNMKILTKILRNCDKKFSPPRMHYSGVDSSSRWVGRLGRAGLPAPLPIGSDSDNFSDKDSGWRLSSKRVPIYLYSIRIFQGRSRFSSTHAFYTKACSFPSSSSVLFPIASLTS